MLVESPALARRFDEASFGVSVGDAKRVDTYVKADLTPATCVIIEDNGRRSLRKVLQAVRAAGGTLIWVLGTTPEDARRADELRQSFPEITSLTLAELTGPPLQRRARAGRSTRQRVQQYQRYLSDADRILILLHNDPDPDAIASGLALRNLLRRTRQTAIIGCMYGVTRPGEPADAEAARPADRGADARNRSRASIALRWSTCSRTTFPGLLPHADLVIDHHPEQTGYNAVFKDIRPHYGSTSHDPHRAPARRRHRHLGAHGDGDALRDQVGHAVLQSPGESRRPRRVLVSLSAGRRDDDPQDGRLGNHRRAARLRDQGVAARPDGRARVLRVHRRAVARRLHSRTSPTSTCSSRTSSGR